MLKVREARSLLRDHGYVPRRGKGSHEIWTHPADPGDPVILCDRAGADIHHYQQLRIRRLQKLHQKGA